MGAQEELLDHWQLFTSSPVFHGCPLGTYRKFQEKICQVAAFWNDCLYFSGFYDFTVSHLFPVPTPWCEGPSVHSCHLWEQVWGSVKKFLGVRQGHVWMIQATRGPLLTSQVGPWCWLPSTLRPPRACRRPKGIWHETKQLPLASY